MWGRATDPPIGRAGDGRPYNKAPVPHKMPIANLTHTLLIYHQKTIKKLAGQGARSLRGQGAAPLRGVGQRPTVLRFLIFFRTIHKW